MPPRLLKSAILTPESLIECRTGVFSWCVISWFLLSVKREFRNYSSWLVTRQKVLRDPWRTRIVDRYFWFYHPILRGFETQIFRMVRVVYRQCIESDLGMPFPIWSLDFAFHDQLLSSIAFKHSFWRKNRLLKRLPLLLILVIRGNEIFISVIHDPLVSPFVNRARDPHVRPSFAACWLVIFLLWSFCRDIIYIARCIWVKAN